MGSQLIAIILSIGLSNRPMIGEDEDDKWLDPHKCHGVWDESALDGVGDWEQRWGDMPEEQQEHRPDSAFSSQEPVLFSDNEDPEDW